MKIYEDQFEKFVQRNKFDDMQEHSYRLVMEGIAREARFQFDWAYLFSLNFIFLNNILNDYKQLF